MALPGLELISLENYETQDGGLELESFTGSFIVPQAHRFGRCRPYTTFVKLCTLEKGSFGKKYKCQDPRDNKIVILKKYENLKNSEGLLTTMLYELDVLNNLKHINIVNLIETVAGKNIDCVYLVQDFCEYSLATLIEKKCDLVFEPPVVKYIIKNLCEGLAYIHAQKLIHRNICNENIMFNEAGVLKIASFENSCIASWKKKPLEFQSPIRYRAPEILLEVTDYQFVIDMWSTGCVFAELLLKKPLFDAESSLGVMKNIMTFLGPPNDNIWPGYSQLPRVQEFIAVQPHSYTESPEHLKILDNSKESFSFLLSLLLYNPLGRLTSKYCIKDAYFTTEPMACSVEEMGEKLELEV